MKKEKIIRITRPLKFWRGKNADYAVRFGGMMGVSIWKVTDTAMYPVWMLRKKH